MNLWKSGRGLVDLRNFLRGHILTVVCTPTDAEGFSGFGQRVYVFRRIPLLF